MPSTDPDSHASPTSVPQTVLVAPPDLECMKLSLSSDLLPFNLSPLTDVRAEIPGSVSYPNRNDHLPNDMSEADVDTHNDFADSGADPASRIACRTPGLPHDTVIDSYMLPRTYLSSSRLNYQFYLWRETLPFPRLLHPCIPLPTPWPSAPHWTNHLSSSAPLCTEPHPYPTPPTASSQLAFASQALQIADVATGTAIWPIQLARKLPISASLCGFDISLSQAPPRAWLPPNLELREWDVFTPVPDNCVGRFDVVHVRLLLLVLTPATVRIVVRRLGQMLRHGGWLQWEELDLARTCLRRAEGEVAATTALPVLESMLGVLQREGDEGWVSGLEDAVCDEGFEDVRVERYWDGVQEARAVFEMHLIKDEEMVRRSGMDEMTRDAALRRIDDMYDESRRGAVLCSPKLVCMARKWGQEIVNVGASEPVDGELVLEEPVEGDMKPLNEKPLNEESMNERSMNEKPMDWGPVDEKQMDEKPADERPADERAEDERPAGERPVGERSVDEELMN